MNLTSPVIGTLPLFEPNGGEVEVEGNEANTLIGFDEVVVEDEDESDQITAERVESIETGFWVSVMTRRISSALFHSCDHQSIIFSHLKLIKASPWLSW